MQGTSAFGTMSPQATRVTQGSYYGVPPRVSSTTINALPTSPAFGASGYTSLPAGAAVQPVRVVTPTMSPMINGSTRVVSGFQNTGNVISQPSPIVRQRMASTPVAQSGMAFQGVPQGGFAQQSPLQQGTRISQQTINRPGVGISVTPQGGIAIGQQMMPQPGIGVGQQIPPQGGMGMGQQMMPQTGMGQQMMSQPGMGMGQPGFVQSGLGMPQPIGPSAGTLTLKIPSAKIAKDHDLIGKMDPFATITIGDQHFKTKVAKSAGQDPKWDDVFNIPIRDQHDVKIEVFDKDTFGSSLIGQTVIPMQVLMGQPGGNIYNLTAKDGKTIAGQIQVLSQFVGPNSSSQGSHLFTGAAGGLAQSTLTTGTPVPMGQMHPGQTNMGQFPPGQFAPGQKIAAGTLPPQLQNLPPSPFVGTLYTKVQNGKFIKNHDFIGKMDTYVVVTVGDQQFKTEVAKSGGKEPQWNTLFAIPVMQAPGAHIQVYDKEMIGKDSLIGETFLPMQALAGQGSQTNWFPVNAKDGRQSGQLLIASEFTPGPPGQAMIPQQPVGAGMIGNATGANAFNPIPSGPPVSGTFTVRPQAGHFLKNADLIGKMDPYIIITVGEQQFKTQIAKSQGKEPQWEDTFSIPVMNQSVMQLQVFDKDTIGKDDFIGTAYIPLAEVAQKMSAIGWYPVRDEHGKEAGQLYIGTEFLPPGADPNAYMYGQQPQGQRPLRNVLDMGFGAYGKLNPGYVPQPVIPQAQSVYPGQSNPGSYTGVGQGYGSQYGALQQAGGYYGEQQAQQLNPYGAQSQMSGQQGMLSNSSYRNLPTPQQANMQRSYSTGAGPAGGVAIGTGPGGAITIGQPSPRGLGVYNFNQATSGPLSR